MLGHDAAIAAEHLHAHGVTCRTTCADKVSHGAGDDQGAVAGDEVLCADARVCADGSNDHAGVGGVVVLRGRGIGVVAWVCATFVGVDHQVVCPTHFDRVAR